MIKYISRQKPGERPDIKRKTTVAKETAMGIGSGESDLWYGMERTTHLEEHLCPYIERNQAFSP